MKYLFVGGPADGQRVEVPDETTYYQIPVFPDPLEFAISSPHDSLLKVTTYRKEWLRDAHRQDYAVFVVDGSGESLIAALIAKYPNKRAPGTIEVPVKLAESLVHDGPASPGYIGHLRSLAVILQKYFQKHGS